MPKLLDNIDSYEMTSPEDDAAIQALLNTPEEVDDLTDGGMVGEVRVTPMQDGMRQKEGRPNAIRAWTWDGRESLLPLSWDPSGKIHDSAMRYRRKRVCLCCKSSIVPRPGTKPQCANCIKAHCQFCRRGQDTAKIIPLYYLRREDVPYPRDPFGHIDCFLESCVRTGLRGFKTEEEMRMHARTRHRMEYAAHMESQRTDQASEMEMLRQQVATLTANALARPAETVPAKRPQTEKQLAASRANMEKARAAREAKQNQS